MKSEEIVHRLLYIYEHTSCINYLPNINLGFSYCEPSEKISIQSDYVTKNYLFLFIKGEAHITCNQFCNRTFNAGEMVLIPRASKLIWETDKGVLILILGFDVPESPCDKLNFKSLCELSRSIEYDFQPLPIRYPITIFNEVLIFLLKQKMNCVHLHLLKQQELFLLLRRFYTKEELAKLFYPMLSKNMDFKDTIIKNSKNVNSVEELIKRSYMGKSYFHAKFKEEFGISAKQWLLKQKAQFVRFEMSRPGASVKTVMAACEFDSPALFNQFCRQHFNSTPKKLIEQYQSCNQELDDSFIKKTAVEKIYKESDIL